MSFLVSFVTEILAILCITIVSKLPINVIFWKTIKKKTAETKNFENLICHILLVLTIIILVFIFYYFGFIIITQNIGNLSKTKHIFLFFDLTWNGLKEKIILLLIVIPYLQKIIYTLWKQFLQLIISTDKFHIFCEDLTLLTSLHSWIYLWLKLSLRPFK